MLFKLRSLDSAELLRERLVLLVLPRGAATPAELKRRGARDVLVLDTEPWPEHALGGALWGKYGRLADVRESNCTVAVLCRRSAFALADRSLFEHFDTLLVPFGLHALCAAVGLAIYGRRRQLFLLGAVQVGGRRYIALKSGGQRSERRVRFFPSRRSADAIWADIALLRHCVMDYLGQLDRRRIESTPILIAADNIDQLREHFAEEICTRPITLYTENGFGGHRYKLASYFMPHMARAMLDSATARDDGLCVASAEWQFLAYCFHLLFHEPSARVNPGAEAIDGSTFGEPVHLQRLEELAETAGRAAPRSFTALEQVLKQADAFPSIDLIGFYMAGNAFLQQRYAVRSLPPGLVTFYVRDYAQDPSQLAAIRAGLTAQFDILAEGPLEGDAKARVVKSVRGGNWLDLGMPDGTAEPFHWFLCWDRKPRPPSSATRNKSLTIDNENVLLKHRLRVRIDREGRKTQRVLHSSDNSMEALEHARILNVGEIAERALGLADGNGSSAAVPRTAHPMRDAIDRGAGTD